MSETEILRDASLRVTATRVHALKVLNDAEVALTPSEIQSRLESFGIPIDKATIYRTLECFEEHHLVHRIPSQDNQWLFSRGNPHHDESHPHVHFHCQECDQTLCVEAKSLSAEIVLPETEASEFLINETEILLHGLCPSCNAS